MSRSILAISLLTLSLSCSLFDSSEAKEEDEGETLELSPTATWVAFLQPLFDQDREIESQLAALAAQVSCTGGPDSTREDEAEACAALGGDEEPFSAETIASELSEALIPSANALVEALDQYGRTETACSLDATEGESCPSGQSCKPDAPSPDAMTATGTCYAPIPDSRIVALHRELQAHWMDRAMDFQAIHEAWTDRDLEALDAAFHAAAGVADGPEALRENVLPVLSGVVAPSPRVAEARPLRSWRRTRASAR